MSKAMKLEDIIAQANDKAEQKRRRRILEENKDAEKKKKRLNCMMFVLAETVLKRLTPLQQIEPGANKRETVAKLEKFDMLLDELSKDKEFMAKLWGVL